MCFISIRFPSAHSGSEHSEHLRLSENNRVITNTDTDQSYPDHPDRFDQYWQVLCRERVCGRCYWEIKWNGSDGVYISVSYKSISRKGLGNECGFGFNDQSWSLYCTRSNYSFRHNNVETVLPVKPISSRIEVYDYIYTIGVFVDHSAGIMAFYSVSDTMSLIHTVQTTFTQPLYPGIYINYVRSSVVRNKYTGVEGWAPWRSDTGDIGGAPPGWIRELGATVEHTVHNTMACLGVQRPMAEHTVQESTGRPGLAQEGTQALQEQEVQEPSRAEQEAEQGAQEPSRAEQEAEQGAQEPSRAEQEAVQGAQKPSRAEQEVQGPSRVEQEAPSRAEQEAEQGAQEPATMGGSQGSSRAEALAQGPSSSKRPVRNWDLGRAGIEKANRI
ncbi:Stonustoxin subunit alpha [Labeo rohita]|uniref:Stonustoxin subunit alpha n=1 Tax=Labeo rohita TaxID=84645 RepID=A0ABQ8L5Q0_LABRO|nr:Stonustoxin subunit alpha [Labeo rohita]